MSAASSSDGSIAAEREDVILTDAGLARDSFAAVRAIAEGTRRDAAIPITGTAVAAADDVTIEVAFTLPGGAYATTVMRELMKTEPG